MSKINTELLKQLSVDDRLDVIKALNQIDVLLKATVDINLTDRDDRAALIKALEGLD